MTTDLSALRLAIDLLHAPSRVRVARSRPLPEGMDFLLRLAARDEAAEIEAVEACGRSRDVVREAAIFFVEQVLVGPGSDSYRMLGADRQAPAAELRRNMALLLRSFHPDIERDRDRSMTAAKVIRAWDDLKTPQRRASYDCALASVDAGKSAARTSHGKTRKTRRLHAALEPASANRSNGRRPSFAAPAVERPGHLLRAILFLFGRNKTRSRPRT